MLTKYSILNEYFEETFSSTLFFYCTQIRLSGMATYINNHGLLENDAFGPEIKTVVATPTDNRVASLKENKLETRFDFLKPNTNYTVNVCAVTRQKECGKVNVTLFSNFEGTAQIYNI